MFTTFVISLWVYLWTLHHTLPSKVILNVFLPLDHRLNATVHKKLQAWHEVDCVLRCLNDTCCRSVNYLKTLDFGKEEDDNKDNCELLHDAAGFGKNNSLLRNGDYDYFILKNPESVSICTQQSNWDLQRSMWKEKETEAVWEREGQVDWKRDRVSLKVRQKLLERETEEVRKRDRGSLKER